MTARLLAICSLVAGTLLVSVEGASGDLPADNNWTSPTDIAAGTDSEGLPEGQTAQTSLRNADAISAAGSHLAVVWDDHRGFDPYTTGVHELEFRHSDDAGSSWGPLTQVSEQPNSVSFEPDVVSTETSDLVAYNSPGTVVTRLPRSGTPSTVEIPGSGGTHSIVASGGHAYLAYGWDTVNVTVSTDDGQSWSAPTAISSFGGGYGFARPDVAADGLDVSVTYLAIPAGATKTDVFVRNSDDGGVTWDDPIPLSSTAFGEAPAAVIADGDRRIAAWITPRSDSLSTVDVAVSTDDGSSWTEPATVASLPFGYQGGGGSPTLLKTPDGYVLLLGWLPRALVSSDGISWTTGALPLFGATKSNYFFVANAATDGSHIFTSSGARIFRSMVDTTRPTLTAVSGTLPAPYTRDRTVAFEFTSTDPDDSSASVQVHCLIDGQNQCKARELTEGPHVLRAVAVDAAGNISDPVLYRWTVDRTAPVVSVRIPDAPRTTKSRVKVSWRPDDDTPVAHYYVRVSRSKSKRHLAWSYPSNLQETQKTGVRLRTAQDEWLCVSARAQDVVGNTGQWSGAPTRCVKRTG